MNKSLIPLLIIWTINLTMLSLNQIVFIWICSILFLEIIGIAEHRTEKWLGQNTQYETFTSELLDSGFGKGLISIYILPILASVCLYMWFKNEKGNE